VVALLTIIFAGLLGFAIGFFLRVPVRNNPDSLGLFIGMQLFLVCSPAAFLAFNYIVYGRLIQTNVGGQYSLLRPNLVAGVFVASDIITFLIQVSSYVRPFSAIIANRMSGWWWRHANERL
jgi:hypothetical protein